MTARRLVALVVALAALGGVLYAQSGATGSGRTASQADITINVNPRNAQVTIDKVTRTAPGVFRLASGTYNVTVQMAGFRTQTFVLTVDAAKGSQTVNYTLQPENWRLTVRANVREATVTLNRALQKGGIPWTAELPPGNYALVVAAPGYQDFTQNVVLDRDVVVDVTLVPALFRLTVTTALKEASITVNRLAKGALPYREDLPVGTYNIVVSAPGYEDFLQTVNLDRPVTITAELKPAMALLTLPEKYLEGQVQFVKLYVDGKLVNAQLAVRGNLQVPAGKHVIRLASAPAGLAMEAEFVFVAGETYEIRPSLMFLTPQQVRAEAGR